VPVEDETEGLAITDLAPGDELLIGRIGWWQRRPLVWTACPIDGLESTQGLAASDGFDHTSLPDGLPGRSFFTVTATSISSTGSRTDAGTPNQA
jgi:hypothetical protein